MLLVKAKEFATEFGVAGFEASGGFLDRWKARHGVTFRKVCGEERAVSEADTSDWLGSSLPELLSSFAPEDIFNVDETGLFYKLKPDKTLDFKGTVGALFKDILAESDGFNHEVLLIVGPCWVELLC